jgi:hypothetical protein
MAGDIENPEVPGAVPEATEAQRNQFKKALQLIQAKHEGEPEKALEEFNKYVQEHAGIAQTIYNDIYGADAFNIELVVPELIHEGQLQDFFKTVLNQYSTFSTEAIERDYTAKPKDWFESKSNRARLVLAEATQFNLKEIATAVVNASPLERVVPVGLDAEKQVAFKEALVDEWNVKFEAKGDDYKNAVLNALRDVTGKPYTANIADYSLQELMGPHAFTQEKDISFENMQRELGTTFASKIDEVILLGNDNTLAEQLPGMSQAAEAQQYLALKASAFAEGGNSPYWTAHIKAEHEPLKVLVASKNPEAILAPGKFEVNPDLDQLFTAAANKNGLKPKELEFLKNLFLKNSLYMNNLSPQLYATTITKAQSGINGKGSVVVGNALPWAIIGRVIATAYGARFAINSTMVDTANDLHQGQQEHRLGYKNMFTALAVDGQAKKQENAFESALDHLFATYAEVERSPEVTAQVDKSNVEMNYALEHANNANEKNEYGIKLLTPQPLNFAYGVIATGLGLAATFSQGFNPSQVFPVFGASMFTGATSLLAVSLNSQRNANLDLAEWHRASARARQSSKTGQDLRDAKIKERTAELTTGVSPSNDRDLFRSNSQDETKSQEEELRSPLLGGDTFSAAEVAQSMGSGSEPMPATSATEGQISLIELSRVPSTSSDDSKVRRSKKDKAKSQTPSTRKKSPSFGS